MTTIAPLQSGIAIAPSAPPPLSDSGELREAAQAFEAIFLRQLLASARASSFGGEELFGGPGLKQFEAMQDEQFAEIASQRGVFGLAEAIERQLSAFAAPVGA
ncbi:MAG: rod-binding protein [Erythrobacter sp.]|nr:MAG: rod-binding protein [Erythrobacter sp.]